MIPDSVYDELATHGTPLSRERIEALYDLGASAPAGEFWECGVYRGGSAYAMVKGSESVGIWRTIRLFDTFTGLPEPDQAIDLRRYGEYASPVEHALRILDHTNATIKVHEGLIPDTFQGLGGVPIAMAHIDLDLYWPTKRALDFVWPRLVAGGIVVIDDFGGDDCPGVTKAVDEWADRNGVSLDLSVERQAVATKPSGMR